MGNQVWVNNRGGRQGARRPCGYPATTSGGEDGRRNLRGVPQIAARYPRFVDRAADYATPERTWKTEVKVFKGPTGCGKTRLAHELYPGIWTKPAGVWFDSYDRHPHVLIDDFAGGRDCGISFRTSFGSLTGTLWTSLLRGSSGGSPSHRHHH